jgi:hypothetical protein
MGRQSDVPPPSCENVTCCIDNDLHRGTKLEFESSRNSTPRRLNMRQVTLILALGVLLVGCSGGQSEVETDPTDSVLRTSTGTASTPDEKNENASENASVAARLGIPPGHLPPPGQCKVWMPGEPPGQQKKKYSAGECSVVRGQVLPGGWLVYRPGEDKKEVIVSEYGSAGVITWEAVYDVVTGALLRDLVPQR